MNKNFGKKRATCQIRNPKALEIINERSLRDHISAATAGALIIIESQKKQQGHRIQFLDQVQVKDVKSIS